MENPLLGSRSHWVPEGFWIPSEDFSGLAKIWVAVDFRPDMQAGTKKAPQIHDLAAPVWKRA